MRTTKPTELIKQRSQNDCFVACLAMAEGTTYEEIADRIGFERMETIYDSGLYGNLIKEVFDTLGWMENYHYRHTLGFEGNLAWRLSAWLFERPALLQFPSLNFTSQTHIVYWDGRELFDPSPRKTYTVDDLKHGCQHVWLINPAVRE